jgi:hypothetical protein
MRPERPLSLAPMKKPKAPEPFAEPVATKELAPLLGRSVRWVQDECAKQRIKTLPIGRPFRIPADEANRLAGLNGAASHHATTNSS